MNVNLFHLFLKQKMSYNETQQNKGVFMEKFWIHAGVLIDGTGADPKRDQAICIENGRIVRIEDYHGDHGENWVDLSGKTVMPGMINCHVHCLSPVGISDEEEQALTTMEKAWWGIRNAADYINSGVTFVRSLGSENFYDMEIKKMIEDGKIIGPHMRVAGRVICMTGGHGWKNGLESDGVDECRKNTRLLLRQGVDLVKIMATGGVMTKGVEPGSAQLTMEEMKAAIEEAHKADRKTATHAQGTQGIKNALRAGIDSVEHGIFLDEECIEMMVRQGTYLVPTLAAPRCIVDAGEEKGLKDYVLRKARAIIDAHVESFRKAMQRGVKIAMGTDAGTPYNFHNNSALELELMVANGMTPMEAIVTATRNGADCIGVLQDYGTIEEGKIADIIALAENPLDDIRHVRQVETVFKAGERLKG